MSGQKIYQTGKIYSIRSYQTDKIYIGSTFNPLYKRLGQHKSDYKRFQNGRYNNVKSFEILKFDDAYIELIQEYQNLTKEQLNKYEGEFIRANSDCVNRCVAGRTKKEYCKDNAESITLYGKIKHNCECGGKYTNVNSTRHKQTKKHLNFINQ